MDFELSDDQKMIRSTVADFVKKELPVTRMRKMREDETGFSRDVYRQMGELGWLGIALPEAAGGFGGSFVDAAIVLEQFGTTLVSEPYAESLVAARAIVHAGTETQQETFLGPHCAGESVLTLAHHEADIRYDLGGVQTKAEKVDGGYRLVGRKRWVLAGHAADQLVVSARVGAGEIGLFMVDASEVTRKAVKTMDGRRAAMVELDVEVGAERRLGEGDASRALSRAIDDGAAACCAEGYGIMKTALNMAVEYLKTREQFGVKIGTFQALQHHAVDMFVETELCKSMSILASIRADEDEDAVRERGISTAKAQLTTGGKFVLQQATQLHGGIGVTDEHDIGLYFKRMHTLHVLYGDENHHVSRFSRLPGFAA